jgi:hypothetical protein
MVDSKLAHIRAQADTLGVKYHHNAKVATIAKAIDQHLINENDAQTAPVPLAESAKRAVDPNEPPEAVKRFLKTPVIPLTEEEYKEGLRRKNRKNVGALVRCRVQCMNPAKRDWPGEIISVGSAKLGTFKKYVPFNNEEYHIPKIIYDMMVEKKCSAFFNGTDNRGHKTRKARQISEYAIEVLTPLTPQEIKELARKQAMAAGTGNL